MAGTIEGGRKAALANLTKDPNFYKNIGTIGGKTKKNKPSGFAYLKVHDPKKLSLIGSKGGTTSRRGPAAK